MASQESEAAEQTGRKQRGRPFQKGQSGNSHGRPGGSRNEATVLLDKLGSESAGMIVQAVIENARRGDVRAAEIILRRCSPEPKGRIVRLDLPRLESLGDAAAAIAGVIETVAEGSLPPAEGSEVIALLEKFIKAREVTEIEDRLAALERRVNGTSA
jgi:hypothetical protein